jgi:hypothetical protein
MRTLLLLALAACHSPNTCDGTPTGAGHCEGKVLVECIWNGASDYDPPQWQRTPCDAGCQDDGGALTCR